MFWKRKKTLTVSEEQSEQASEQIRRDRMRLEYANALRQIDVLFSQAKNVEVRAAILDYAMKVVKRDLIGEGLSQIVYGRKVPEWRAAFPLGSPPQKAECIPLELSEMDVLVTPWEVDRFSKAIRNLLYAPFDQKEDYYTATYYPEIKLAIIGDGMHHTAVASVGVGGIIDRCAVVQMTPAFEEVSTDGAIWANSRTGSLLQVDDFRFALLYTLAKMRYELSEGQPDVGSR